MTRSQNEPLSNKYVLRGRKVDLLRVDEKEQPAQWTLSNIVRIVLLTEVYLRDG